MPQLLAAATGTQAETQRHKEAEEPPRADGQLDNKLRPLPDHDSRRAMLPEGPRYYLQHGHIYRCLDSTAGCRSYVDKFWVGRILQAAVDVFTGGLLAVQAIAADEAEHLAYPALLELCRTATGAYPDRVSGDRGYSVATTFMHNTERGIASVFPWRKPNNMSRADTDCDEFDRHGVPRCHECGAPGDITSAGLGFHITSRGEPVILFRCELALTHKCDRIQQISCAVEARCSSRSADSRSHTTPCTSPARTLSASGVTGEPAVAQEDAEPVDEASGLAVDDGCGCRVQRIGCQETRSASGIGSRVKHHRSVDDGSREEAVISGTRRLASILSARKRHGLNFPYGQAAFDAGFALDPDPPPKPRVRTSKRKK